MVEEIKVTYNSCEILCKFYLKHFVILKLFHSRHAAGSERQVRGHQHDSPRNHPAMEAKQFARKSIQK